MKTIGLITNKKSKKVFLLPEHVYALKKANMTIYIQAGYGKVLNIDDSTYVSAGAHVMQSVNEVITNSDVICKVEAFDKAELHQMSGKIAVTMANYLANVDMLYHMLEKNVTGLAWNNLIDKSQYVFFREIEELKGEWAVKTIINGMEKGLAKPKEKVVYPHPAKLLILNGTYGGVAAAKLALANGFDVTVLDYDKDYLKNLENDSDIKNLCRKYSTKFTTGSADFGNLEHQIAKYNAFINVAIDPTNLTKLRITKEMADSMPKGSILVDTASEYGYAFAWVKKFAPANLVYTRFNKEFYVEPQDCTNFFAREVSEIISKKSIDYLIALANEGQANAKIANIVICNKGKMVDVNVKTQLHLY